MRLFAPLLCLLLVAACPGNRPPSTPGEGFEEDGGFEADASSNDAGVSWDAGPADSGAVDGGAPDSGLGDAGPAGMGTWDGGGPIQYLKASNPESFDSFGVSVSLFGDTLAVGAYRESSSATGVDGTQSDNDAGNSGAVYVFRRSGGVWAQEAYLKASNTGANDQFGCAVSLSGDTLAVGAENEGSASPGINGDQTDDSAPVAGAVYVFVRNGAIWSQQAYLKASNPGPNDMFGHSLSLNEDRLAVGAWGESSSATGINGNQADNSAFLAGAVYVFLRAGSTWSQEAYLKASNAGTNDQFGISVALFGDTLAVGAPGEDSSAQGVNGPQTDNLLSDSGAVYLFGHTGGSWTQTAYLKASNSDAWDTFGQAVSLYENTLVATAPGEDSSANGINGNQLDEFALQSGAAYLFERSGATWTQVAYLKASNTAVDDAFGCNVSVSRDAIAVSTRQEASKARGLNGNQTDNTMPWSGAAYVFTRSGTTWQQRAYVKASNTDSSDQFGVGLSLWGETLVVGAPWESGGASGVNGNALDNSAGKAGAVYVY